jgi:hypothetical protein
VRGRISNVVCRYIPMYILTVELKPFLSGCHFDIFVSCRPTYNFRLNSDFEEHSTYLKIYSHIFLLFTLHLNYYTFINFLNYAPFLFAVLLRRLKATYAIPKNIDLFEWITVGRGNLWYDRDYIQTKFRESLRHESILYEFVSVVTYEQILKTNKSS